MNHNIFVDDIRTSVVKKLYKLESYFMEEFDISVYSTDQFPTGRELEITTTDQLIMMKAYSVNDIIEIITDFIRSHLENSNSDIEIMKFEIFSYKHAISIPVEFEAFLIQDK